MKIEHRIKFKNAEVIYVSVYKNKTIMHHHPKRLIFEDRKYDVGCWIKKHKSMINKDFKAINGSVVNVEIFAKRITLTNQDFKYSFSSNPVLIDIACINLNTTPTPAKFLH